MSPRREDELAMADKNPFTEWADDRLVAAAYVRGQWPAAAIETEMMRRLKESLDAGNASSTALTRRLERLNVWLLWITILIGALTFVQLALAIGQVVIAMKAK